MPSPRKGLGLKKGVLNDKAVSYLNYIYTLSPPTFGLVIPLKIFVAASFCHRQLIQLSASTLLLTLSHWFP